MKENEKNDTHARFSPSKLPRILDCPGSVQLVEAWLAERGDVQERQSTHAAKGTFLHSVMEDHLLRDQFEITTVLHEDPVTHAEYKDACESLLRWVSMLKASAGPDFVEHIENKVSLKGFEEYTGCDLLTEVEGTVDYTLTSGRILHVADWKFGNLLVDPETPQLLGYAAGALKNPVYAEQFDKIICYIGQPLSGDQCIKHVEYSVPDVLRWIKYALSPALLKTKATPPILNPTTKACQWCDVKARCSARKHIAMLNAETIFAAYKEIKENPHLVTIEELALALDVMEFNDQYARDIATYAFNYIQTGRDIPGYKVVSGRATRKWVNEQEAQKALEALGYDVSELSDVKFYGPAKVEKLVTKQIKKSEEFLALITKSEPGLTLAKATDKRQAINFRTAEEVFGDYVDSGD